MFRQSGSSTFVETDLDRLKELAKQEALNQTAAERAALAQQQQQVAQDLAFTHIFRTVVPGRGIPADNQANRGFILGWLHEDQQEAVSLEWFLKVLNENPSLGNVLVWEKPLTAKERKAQEEKTAQALRAKFAQVCRIHQIAETEANFQLWSSVDNPVMTELHGKPCILNEDGEILELTPASETEKNQWEQERFEAKQQRLREMAAAGDIAGLRQASQQERAERSQNVVQLHRDYSLLRGFVTRQEYLLPPLPPTWNGRPLDATRIKQGGREIISQIGKKHGFERINAVLYGLDESFFSDWANKLRHLEYQLTGVKGSSH